MMRRCGFLLLLAAFAVLPAPAVRAEAFRIPILCYHSVTDKGNGRFVLSTGAFEEQMQYLYVNGYTVLSLDKLVEFLTLYKQGRAKAVNLPQKPVVITFDDNFFSIPLNALPILKLYGFPAANFLYTLFMTDTQWRWYRKFAGQGLTFSSHTCNHVDLTRRKAGESDRAWRKRIYREMKDSRKIIARGLGSEVLYLAYPFGNVNPEVRQFARLAGYRAMFSALGGYVTDKTELDNIPRFTMFRNFSMEMFQLIVSGGWNRGLEDFVQDPRDFKIRDYNFDFK